MLALNKIAQAYATFTAEVRSIAPATRSKVARLFEQDENSETAIAAIPSIDPVGFDRIVDDYREAFAARRAAISAEKKSAAKQAKLRADVSAVVAPTMQDWITAARVRLNAFVTASPRRVTAFITRDNSTGVPEIDRQLASDLILQDLPPEAIRDYLERYSLV